MPRKFEYIEGGEVKEVGFHDLVKDKDSTRVIGILNRLGVTDSDIEHFYGLGDISEQKMVEKSYEAAEVFKQRGFSSFSTTHLAMLILNCDWDASNAKSFKRRLADSLKANLGREAKRKSDEFGFEVTPVQIVREETGNYQGNLYDVRSIWHNFSASDEDMRNSTRLPDLRGIIPDLRNVDQYAKDMIYLIGCMYGCSTYTTGKFNSPSRVIMLGDKKDGEFFSGTLDDLIKKGFNLEDSLSRRKKKNLAGDKDYNIPIIEINSTAIATWLTHDLGFRSTKTLKRVKFPGFCITDEMLQYFFSGLTSAKANGSGRRRIIYSDSNIEFIDQVEEAVKRVIPGSYYARHSTPTKYNPQSTTNYIVISSLSSDRLRQALDLRNPKLLLSQNQSSSSNV
jgi:hypothetical protein